MNSILRSVSARISVEGKDTLVKRSLMCHLSESVKEVHLELKEKGEGCGNTLDNTDATNSLCISLEAIFVHGLKDTFINRVSMAISGDVDHRPEPNFWGPLLVFSHRDIIYQILGLSQIQTDVGRCRAWLRQALNDGLLPSYLEAMRRDPSALSPYYQRTALLKDMELLEVIQQLVQGVETYPFTLACNSSVLNTWTDAPLLLSALWTPPMRSCPIPSGVDVARKMDELPEEQSPISLYRPYDNLQECPSSPHGSLLSQPSGLDEEEKLKIILGSDIGKTSASDCQSKDDNVEKMNEAAVKSSDETREHGSGGGTDVPQRTDLIVGEGNCGSLGNSLAGRVGWSSSFDEVADRDDAETNAEIPEAKERKKSPITKNIVSAKGLKSPGEMQSYHSLLESYNLLSSSYVKTPDLRDFLQKFEGSVPVNECSNVEAEDPEFRTFVGKLGKITTEPGLDSQKYCCANCNLPIGITSGDAKVCSFLGAYYCSECQLEDEMIIPARVIHNWDFRKYPVSCSAAAFLNEIQHQPLLDLKILNPTLYNAVDDMTRLQNMRIQLNLLRAYLFTCREPIIEELQKRVWPRSYLYEHVHLYSVLDLQQIPSGALAHFLQEVVAFARNHVLSCWLCSQKAFICEMCKNPKVIYPFDTDSTFRCGHCNAVFHSSCLDSSRPCPKCDRRKRREDITLLEPFES
ncbi:differentially expressed in FDCP 8 homolog isoform X2 [Hetaerina americana]|uniref:differentially expressed in FDCP 8 homolog isoform X2 n=1 Tax=Hetaerina americana TaxID=62018 RepID=UPI003A7F13FF